MEKSLGFSLLELMVALGIAVVLVGIGAAALRNTTLDARRTAALNGLLRAVHSARAEAQRTGREVVLCARDPATMDCAGEGGDWSGGWLVFVNEDGDRPAAVDGGEPVLLDEGPLTGATLAGNRTAFRFLPFNRRSTNGTLVYCDRRGAASARALIVSFTGRPRLSDEDPPGRGVACGG
jgi:type IV fimbrial biogenesis protein FimT